jgi:hypothetical protein
MTPTPARHAKQGLYRANRGFASRHRGHIGRRQHFVTNSSESSTFGGNDEEHARQSVVLRSNMMISLSGWFWEETEVGVVDVRRNRNQSLNSDRRHSDVPLASHGSRLDDRAQPSLPDCSCHHTHSMSQIRSTENAFQRSQLTLQIQIHCLQAITTQAKGPEACI